MKKEGKYLLGNEGNQVIGGNSRYDELKKLHELKEKGAITDEEYGEKRKKLIKEL